MLKRIKVSDLTVGMYVKNIVDTGISLHEHEREGRIKDSKIIQELKKRGITEVFIDSEQGKDSQKGSPLAEIDEKTESNLQSIDTPKNAIKETNLTQELAKASKMHSQALDLVTSAFETAKIGQPITAQPFEHMADQFMDSVIRNQNALACLSRIRDKDSYLMEHSVNVAVLMAIFGKHLELEPSYLHQCVTGALLHDIGKILIPDNVLHKPGKLTENEFILMKKHATYSGQMLEQSDQFSDISINVASQHHERLDGKGYPLGLSENSISYEAKLAAVVDIYDAITADRVYHKGMPPTMALKRMLEWSGCHLDKSLVHAFIKAIGVYPVGSFVEISGHKGAVVIEENQKTLTPVVKIFYDLNNKQYLPIKIVDLSKSKVGHKVIRSVDPSLYNISISEFLL